MLGGELGRLARMLGMTVSWWGSLTWVARCLLARVAHLLLLLGRVHAGRLRTGERLLLGESAQEEVHLEMRVFVVGNRTHCSRKNAAELSLCCGGGPDGGGLPAWLPA